MRTLKKNKRIKGLNKTSRNLKMNCNPLVKGKTVSKETCYTVDIIMKIKNEYNKQHSNAEQILINDPTEIWNILKSRLKCGKEDCWLNQIKDSKLKKIIDEYLFAPDAPPEWEKNPNEWLTNYDILDILDQYQDTYPNFEFLGPSPIDFDTKLPERSDTCVESSICNFSLKKQLANKKTKIGFVFNLDKHNEPGSHWVSLFVDMDNKIIYYFDSGGDFIPNEIKLLSKRIREQGLQLNKPIHFKYYDNHGNDHQKGNTECGMYSLFFIITMLTGEVEGNPYTMKRRIRLFSKGNITDKYIENYRHIYYNKK